MGYNTGIHGILQEYMGILPVYMALTWIFISNICNKPGNKTLCCYKSRVPLEYIC